MWNTTNTDCTLWIYQLCNERISNFITHDFQPTDLNHKSLNITMHLYFATPHFSMKLKLLLSPPNFVRLHGEFSFLKRPSYPRWRDGMSLLNFCMFWNLVLTHFSKYYKRLDQIWHVRWIHRVVKKHNECQQNNRKESAELCQRFEGVTTKCVYMVQYDSSIENVQREVGERHNYRYD